MSVDITTNARIPNRNSRICMMGEILCRCCKYPIVETREDTEEHNAYSAKCKGNTSTGIGAERWQRVLCCADIHCLDDEQIVVERHNGVNQRHENNYISPS